MNGFPRADRRVPGYSTRGYSLVELLVTLALVGLLATVGLPALTAGRGAAGLEADARMLAARLRLARETALATRRPAAVTIDFSRAEVTGPGPHQFFRMISVQRLAGITAKGLEQGRTVITFAPDGSSSGGTVVLEEGSHLLRIRVDWLTGVVSVGAGAS